MLNLSMRIMHVISRYNRGGTATWLNTLIAQQRNAGNEVFLLSGSVQDNEAEDGGFKNLGGIRIKNLGKKISIFSDLKAILEVRSFIKKYKPDVLNTHTSKAGLVGRIAAFSSFNGRPAIVHTYHGHILYGYYSKPATMVFKTIEKLLSLLTDVFLVSGERVKSELKAEGIFNDKKVFLTRPGISLEKDIHRTNENHSKVVVGWLGRLTKIKRPDRVLELAKRFPNVTFLVGGEGELESELKSNLPDNVKLLGWVKSDEFWEQCDIALLTSDNEAQPISLIEAALHALPSIGEDVGSVSDVISTNITGYLVNNIDERTIALNNLISNKNLRIEMGIKAKELVSERFSLEQFLTSHKNAYAAALSLRTGHKD